MYKNKYKARAKVWLYPGQTPWHFVTLPKKLSADIKARFKMVKKGWGSLPVTATVGKTSWETSIFPDRKAGAYLLPLKVDVRKKEDIKAGDTRDFSVEIKA